MHESTLRNETPHEFQESAQLQLTPAVGTPPLLHFESYMCACCSCSSVPDTSMSGLTAMKKAGRGKGEAQERTRCCDD